MFHSCTNVTGMPFMCCKSCYSNCHFRNSSQLSLACIGIIIRNEYAMTQWAHESETCVSWPANYKEQTRFLLIRFYYFNFST
uniref:Uncharacterized protein n=1 Tax=Anguilla anguilla TaxID=7936 RepID=A0A0E9WDL5_ANGAN